LVKIAKIGVLVKRFSINVSMQENILRAEKLAVEG
jgi:hypothetical protein